MSDTPSNEISLKTSTSVRWVRKFQLFGSPHSGVGVRSLKSWSFAPAFVARSGGEESEGRLSRKFKAPLQRKAQKKPGSVIDLLKQVSQPLQEVGARKENLLTQGPATGKLLFALDIPALRELFLAVAMDLVRAGQLLWTPWQPGLWQ